MPNDPQGAPRPLPARPNLRHLKDQAKDLLRSGRATSFAKALLALARQYGFPSWTKLKNHVESRMAMGQLADAIDADDLNRVKALLTAKPDLHRAPIGYGGSGALTRVAECRPLRDVTPARLAMASWMIEHGSDIHQDGDSPLGRAALSGSRVPMMELLVSRGADVNGAYKGRFPVIFAPCEAVDPDALQWLLEHGANPNCADPARQIADSALDYVLGSYVRTPELARCIEILLAAGATTRFDIPPVLSLLRGRLDTLSEELAADPSLLHARFGSLDVGTSGERMLTLRGATLLHVAAEYEPSGRAVGLLLDAGADVNARADTDAAGVGGQTALFHAVAHGGATHRWLALSRSLIERGADVNVRARVPGHYEREGELLDCTPLGYAARFSGGPDSETVRLLRHHGAHE
jgi:hypothetical protein